MPKIFDCFVFYNELDLLEIRLNELDPIVDHFVLCEAPVTFKGKPKPLYFRQNRDRYAPFLHKIIHVIVDDMPLGRDDKRSHWHRQTFQRNAIIRGLVDADPDDFVFLSDLDEIPRAKALEATVRGRDKPAIFSFAMEDYRFYVNLRSARVWNRARMARFGDIRTMERLRDGGPTWRPKFPYFLYTLRKWKRMAFGMRRPRPWIVVPDGGWHFSYMNGVDTVSRKMEAISSLKSAAEMSVEAVEARIKKALEEAAQPTGGKSRRLVELDASFPSYLLANRQRFSNLIADHRTFEAFGVTPPKAEHRSPAPNL